MAGLPPTASKGNGETDYVTTFRTNYGTWPVTRTGSLLNLGTLPITMGGTGNTSGTTTINANLTGPITSVGNATSIAAQVGTGTTFVMSASPTITTPSFSGTATGSISGNAGTATNISGGAGGSIPYQTAASTTALLANGTAGQTLTSQGTTLAPIWTTGVPGTEWATNGTHIYNNNAGNVGIGTTAPDDSLSISSSLANTADWYNSGNQQLHITNTNGAGYTAIRTDGNPVTTWVYGVNGASDGLRINPRNNTSGAASFYMDQNGHVGIGTTAPLFNLDISGTTSNRGLNMFPTLGTGANSINMNSSGAGTYLGHESSAGGTITGGVGANESFVGSSGAKSFHLLTNAASRMTIDSSGNVGVGTTAPATNLEINSANDTRARLFSTGGAYSSTLELTTLTAGTYGSTLQYSSNSEDLQFNNYGRALSPADSTSGGFSFITKVANTTPTKVMFIHGYTGNVGIGTTSPLAKLDVVGGIIANNTTVGPAVIARTSGNGHSGVSVNNTTFGSTEATAFGLFQGTSGVAALYNNNISSIAIDTTGKVGIGTTAPLFNLDISGTTSNRGLNMFPTLGTGANSINMNSSGAGTYLGHESSAGGTITGGVGANESFVGSSGAKSFHLLTNAASRMTIDSSGNVGVGTTAPATNLEINSANDTRARLFSTGGAYSSTLELTTLTAGTYGSTLQYSSNSEDLQFNNYGRTSSSADSTLGGFSFITKVANTTPTKVMFIHGYTGKVGIGTVSPAQALDVAGSIVETRSGATWGAVTVKGQATPVLFGATASNGAGAPCSTGTCILDTAIGTNLTSIVRTSAGQYTINYTGMTIVPVCLMSPVSNGGTCYPSIGASTTSTDLFCLSDVGTPTNSILSVQCIGY